MVMDGGSVVAQQPASVMTTAGQQQQQQQQQPAQQQQQQQQLGQAAAGGVQQEPAPNATRVAREFVRQYYTILHESPGLLHRFYNEESDFIHGSCDSACDPGAVTGVRGQQEIHRTILALNFQDCYARIAYVDAQESINKSVVVQVAGELSNRGSPMRRFMQTFVLVPLSARKYYVRNDIFRYQDDIFTEDTADEDELNANEAVSSTPPTSTGQHNAAVLPNGGGDHGHHPTPMNGTPETGLPSSTGPQAADKQLYHNSQPSSDQPSRKDDSSDAVVNNNGGGQWEGSTGQQQQSSQQVTQTKIQPSAQVTQPSAEAVSTETSVPSATSTAQTSETTASSSSSTVTPVVTATTTTTTQRSWSQMVQVKPAADPATVLSTTSQHQQPSFGPPATNSNNSQQTTFGGSANSATSGGLPQRFQHFRGTGPAGPRVNGLGNNVMKKDGGSGLPREDANVPSLSGGNDIKNTYNIPDNQQLFVGNIPTSATEQDLQDLFKQFGTVVGFRLQNSKNSAGLPGGKPSPNFGFVLFDSPEPVQMLLRDGMKTIELTLPSKQTVRLNIEEKKPRIGGKGPRGSGGPPRGGRMPLSNGGSNRRDYNNAGGDRRPPRTPMTGGGRSQTGGHPDSSQH